MTSQISELPRSAWYSNCQTRSFPNSSRLRTPLLHPILPTWSGLLPFQLLQKATVDSTRFRGWFGMGDALPVWSRWSRSFIVYTFSPALGRTLGLGIHLQHWNYLILFTSTALPIVISISYFRRYLSIHYHCPERFWLTGHRTNYSIIILLISALTALDGAYLSLEWEVFPDDVRLALPPITARSAQRRTTFSGVVRVPFRPVCCVWSVSFPGVARVRETSAHRGVLYDRMMMRVWE